MAKKWLVEIPSETVNAEGAVVWVTVKQFKKRKEAVEFTDKLYGSKNGKLLLVVGDDT